MKTEFRIEQIVVVAAIGLLLLGCLLVLRPFISSLLWAAIICFSTWPFYSRLEKLLGKRSSLAALIMTLIVGFVLVLPFAIVGLTLADNVSEISVFLTRLGETRLPPPPEWLKTIPLAGNTLSARWLDFSANSENALELLKTLFARSEGFLLKIGLKLGHGVLQLALSVFIAFFFYRNGVIAATWISGAMTRLAGEHAKQLTQAVGRTIKGVVYGILGTALAQGIVASIGFKIAGVPSPLLLGFLTFCLSLVQVGPPLIWAPVTLWLFATRQTGWAIFMAIWGTLGISGVDNLLRPYLISRGANLPLVVIFLGVLGGILAFGFLGIFLGPILLAAGGVLLRNWMDGSSRDNPAQP